MSKCLDCCVLNLLKELRDGELSESKHAASQNPVTVELSRGMPCSEEIVCKAGLPIPIPSVARANLLCGGSREMYCFVRRNLCRLPSLSSTLESKNFPSLIKQTRLSQCMLNIIRILPLRKGAMFPCPALQGNVLVIEHTTQAFTHVSMVIAKMLPSETDIDNFDGLSLYYLLELDFLPCLQSKDVECVVFY